MQCDVIVYNITEPNDLIDEATWAISGNNSSNFQTTQPMASNVSQVMHIQTKNGSLLGFGAQP